MTEPFEYDHKVAGTDNSVYEGELARNGVEFKCTLGPCKNLNEARSELASSVSSLERMSFTGSYENANTWTGTIIDDGAVLKVARGSIQRGHYQWLSRYSQINIE